MRFLLPLFAFMLPSLAMAQTDGFQTKAPHAIIMDYETGLVLYEKEARDAIAPASMTKIMTADMVFERIRNGSLTMDTKFTVSEEAWRRGGAKSGSSTMFLDLNSQVSVGDLLRGVIIQSGNDACIVLAEGIAGSETAFADMMTQTARKIGLDTATFRNATGWPHSEHKISLFDLAKLARHTIKEYPEFYPLYAERQFTWNDITQGNRNPLLGRFSGADGLKTGHTKVSGYGFVGSAERGGIRRIMVVNGLESKVDRRSESIRVMQAAFDQFDVGQLFKAGDDVAEIDVFMGANKSVAATVSEDVFIGFDRGLRKKIRLKVKAPKELAAPVSKGDIIAELVISIPGRDDILVPLEASQTVNRKSAFGRAMTALSNKFKSSL